MSIAPVLRALARHRVAAGLVAAVALSAPLALYATSAPVYRTSTSLYVAVLPDAAQSSALELGQGNSAARDRVVSYAQVARTALVLRPVVEELGLDETVDELAARVSAAPPTDSVVLTLVVEDQSPARAAEVADAVARSLSEVVASDLEPAGDGGRAPVRLTVLEDARVPTRPETPGLAAHLAVGLALALLGASGVAVLLSRTEVRFRQPSDLAEVTSTPVLGIVPFDPQATSHPLTVQVDPRGRRAEAFRTLRTNLRYVDARGDRRCFLMSSPLPSEGKTTTVCNLAIALAQAGRSVALVDADLRRPRVAEIMDIEGAVGVSDILIGAAELEDVVQPWGRDGLVVLPAGQVPPNPAELVASEGMRALLEELRSTYDHVLVDAPPLLPVSDAGALASLVDGVLVVAAARRTRRRDLAAALDVLHASGREAAALLLTMAPLPRDTRGAYTLYVPRSAAGRDTIEGAE